jgi:hypothetical protein
VWHPYRITRARFRQVTAQFPTPPPTLALFDATLNHAAIPLTYIWAGERSFPMTKHRTITGFVAVALLAVAATATTLRPLPSKSYPNASAGITSISELSADVNKLATDDYDDQSLVYSAKRH